MKHEATNTNTNEIKYLTGGALQKRLNDLLRQISAVAALCDEIRDNFDDESIVFSAELGDLFTAEVLIDCLYNSTAEVVREYGEALNGKFFVSAETLAPFRGFAPVKPSSRA